MSARGKPCDRNLGNFRYKKCQHIQQEEIEGKVILYNVIPVLCMLYQSHLQGFEDLPLPH